MASSGGAVFVVGNQKEGLNLDVRGNKFIRNVADIGPVLRGLNINGERKSEQIENDNVLQGNRGLI